MKNNSINIPEETQLFKIGSFNINLVDSADYADKIDIVVKYVFSRFYETELDIICLQNIAETKLVNLLIGALEDESVRTKNPLQFIPTQTNSTNSVSKFATSTSFDITWNSNNDNENENNDNEIVHNIIVSRYPIISSYCVSLNDVHKESHKDSHNINGKNMVIANININGYLISVYNVTLTEDYLGVSNAEFRKKEIAKINELVKENSIQIKNIHKICGYNLIIKNVHLLCGNFNIAEINNGVINNELVYFFRLLKMIDVFRYRNKDKDSGHTNIFNTRNCYITLLYYTQALETLYEVLSGDVVDSAFKSHGVYNILSYVVNSIKLNDYYPIESIFLLSKKEKKLCSE